MKKIGFVITAFVGLGIAMTGCAATSESEGEGDEAVGTASSAYSNGSVLCVNQSYASAHRETTDDFMMCNNNWNTQLSRGHKVTIKNHCGTSGPYVGVRSWWTGSYYTMREDALGPC